MESDMDAFARTLIDANFCPQCHTHMVVTARMDTLDGESEPVAWECLMCETEVKLEVSA